MRKQTFLFLVIILFASCDIYKYATKYSSHVMKKNGLKFHELHLEKYNLTYWDSETNKPALVLIHGFGTSGQFQWYKEADDLSENYRLVIVNLLYFGSTPLTPSYTVDGQVEAVEVLMQNLNIASFYLCGTSYGGLVASEFTLKYPGKVKKLVLIDTPLKFHTEADISSLCAKYGITNPADLYVPPNPEMFKKLTSITYRKPPKLPMAVFRAFYKNNYQIEEDNLLKIYSSLKNEIKVFDAKDYHFKMPVMLIWGEEDRMVPLHVGKELKEHIGPNARLEIVSKAAHLPNLENEKVVNRLILDFLKD